MFTQSFKSLMSVGIIGVTAAASLSGCVVSDNPAVNTVATVATVGTIASLFYNLSDGYYYDNSYNRLPRDYRPDRNARIQRVDNIDDFRNGNQGRPQPQMNGRNQPQMQQPAPNYRQQTPSYYNQRSPIDAVRHNEYNTRINGY